VISTSFKMQEEAEKRAANKVGNIWSATVAMLRPRLLRYLGLLSITGPATKERITTETFFLVAYLRRRKKLSQSLRKQILADHTEFIPTKHYAVITYNDKHEEISCEYVPLEKVPQKLHYIRDMYHATAVHDMLCDGVIEALDVFADGLYEQTGTAIIKRLMDYTTGRTNYAVDPEAGEEIASAMFGDEKPESGSDKEEPEEVA